MSNHCECVFKRITLKNVGRVRNGVLSGNINPDNTHVRTILKITPLVLLISSFAKIPFMHCCTNQQDWFQPPQPTK